MTTTSPSWFPSWPALFKDIEDAYLRTVPRQWPGGLYRDGTDERRDLDAKAVVFAWVAEGSEWIKQRIFPQYDDDAMFLFLWEEAIAVARAATIALRQQAIISYLRLMLGTATKETIQKIMAPVFGLGDTDSYLDVQFSFASREDVDATGWTGLARAFALSQLHVHVGGDAVVSDPPDRPRALDAIAKWKPTWLIVTVGQYETCKYDTEGGYDTACYGA